MRFEASRIRLVVPLVWAASRRSEKPKGIRSGMVFIAVNDLPGEAYFRFSRSLIKIAFDRRFKPSWALKYHLFQGAYISKVEAIRADTIDANVADHQHAELSFAFGFGAHEPGKQSDVFGRRFNYCHKSIRFTPFSCCAFTSFVISIHHYSVLVYRAIGVCHKCPTCIEREIVL